MNAKYLLFGSVLYVFGKGSTKLLGCNNKQGSCDRRQIYASWLRRKDDQRRPKMIETVTGQFDDKSHYSRY